MIDDELNRLLNDVDETNNFTQARDSNLRSQEKMARKSDKNTGDDFAGQSLQQYNQYINKLKSDKDILLFNCGYINIFQIHYDNCKKIEGALNDLSHPDSVQVALKKYKYSYLRNVENAIKYYNDFLSSQNDSSLKKKAKQDIGHFFQDGDYSDNKINFIVLKEIFLRLREYNSFIRKEFDDLRNGIDAISILSEGKDLYSVLADIIQNSLSYCRKTDRFIAYVGLTLSIPDNDLNVLEKDIYQRIYFRDEIKYDYNSLFDHTPLNLVNEVKDDLEYVLPKMEKPSVQIESVKAVKTASVPVGRPVTNNTNVESLNFNFPGHSVWNTKEPYTISINRIQYSKNIEDIQKIVYFTRSEDDVKMMSANVKRAMLRNVSGEKLNMSDEYSLFIYQYVSNICSIFSEKLDVSGENLDLTVYHLGPENMFKIIKNIFESDQIGLCFKDIGQNKLSRFIPDEFIKVRILNWYEENINSKNLQFNSIQQFNDLKSVAEEKYNNTLKSSMQKIELAAKQFSESSGKTLDKNAVLKKKSRELFTIPMMYLYKRFVEKTIF